MFIISLIYTKDISEVNKYLEAHIAFLDHYYAEKIFIASGRKVPRTGGIILAHNATKQTLEAIVEKDPFKQNQVAEYEITEFLPTKFDEAFKIFTA